MVAEGEVLQHTCKFSHVPQFTVNIFMLIVSNSGYLDHLGLFSNNGFHMFLRRYPSYQEKILTQTETFQFTSTSWKNSNLQKLQPAVTLTWRDSSETAKNDSLF